MVTEITFNDYGFTKGESCEKKDCSESKRNSKKPENSNERQHKLMGHFHMIMQREDDGDQPVVGERHQIKRLHGQEGKTEKQEGHAVVVRDAQMVKQKDVEKLRHQSRAAKQVHKSQVKNGYVFCSSQIVIEND
ncbi:uncharacterized protein V6R79_014684 [Siganus canaliculatus]